MIKQLFMRQFISEPENPSALDPHGPAVPIGPLGVLLVNLGTPQAPTAPAIRSYLREFLSDPRVVELPAWLWRPILNLFVLSRRPKAIKPNYQLIWLERGSPLLVYGQDLAAGLEHKLSAMQLDVRVQLAMRYGEPALTPAIDALRAQGCQRILVVPLYPQYAASTTATAVDAVNAYMARLRSQPSLRYLAPFYADQAYIGALHALIQRHWQAYGKPERLLLSFHGLPQRSIQLGDRYFHDCQQTAQALRQALGVDGALVHVSFQSRFGKAPWLQPYTQPLLEQWGAQGLGRVDLMCPGFVADCLETLEEINIGCRQAFQHSGGGEFHYIPCLNAEPVWVDSFAALVAKNLQNWS